MVAFTGLARGSSERLLAAAPLLMLLQMALLPLYLWLFMGRDLAGVVEPRLFLEAFGLLIALPFALAWATGLWKRRHRVGARLAGAMSGIACVGDIRETPMPTESRRGR